MHEIPVSGMLKLVFSFVTSSIADIPDSIRKSCRAFLINRKKLTNHAFFNGVFALIFINYYALFGLET